MLHYQDAIYAFALRLAGCRADAEDVAQDAFVRAYQALRRPTEEPRSELRFRPWLYRIALNVWRNQRRSRARAGVVLDVRLPDGPADEREQPEQVMDQGETRAQLARLLLGLPERYRAAVILRHVSGFSYPEMTAVLGQPAGTIKSSVHRGTRLLREALERQQAMESEAKR